MYDTSNDLEEFLNEYVILPRKKQSNLRKLSKTNISRLKEGLDEYNRENSRSYKIVEDVIQGSAAMYTVIQSEENNYDIDVAIVFNKDNIGDITSSIIRRIVKEALCKKTQQFNTDPQIKTNCVRIYYEEGYHIDFAVFRRSFDNYSNSYIYEHAGTTWTKREVKGVEDWFNAENKMNSGLLRKIVRLIKQFCSKRSNMPGGLILTALCSECLFYDERLDISFYKTMQYIVDRIHHNKSISIPVDGGRLIAERDKDKQRLDRLENELITALNHLNVLEDTSCTQNKANEAWNYFFNHDYWNNKVLHEKLNNSTELSVRDTSSYINYKHTEQFIEDEYPVLEKYDVKLKTTVTNISGFRDMLLDDYLKRCPRLKQGVNIRCELLNRYNYDFDTLLWKVKNEGTISKQKDMIRGQIKQRDYYIVEPCSFFGDHYIECYLIKNGVCVGIGRVDIPIDR